MFRMRQQLRSMLSRLGARQAEPAFTFGKGGQAMITNRTFAGALSAAALLLLLAGCMVLPGRFASDLSLRRDGTFTFHYKGEIVLAALAQGSKTAKVAAIPAEPFEQ